MCFLGLTMYVEVLRQLRFMFFHVQPKNIVLSASFKFHFKLILVSISSYIIISK